MDTHLHNFNPGSGWCGCGYRDDGRLLSFDGQIFRPGPQYTPQELDQIRRRIEGAYA